MAEKNNTTPDAQAAKPKRRSRKRAGGASGGGLAGLNPATPEEIADMEPAAMAKFINSAEALVSEDGRRTNAPQMQIQKLEVDDQKREFIAKTTANMLELWRLGMAHPVQNDDEICERLDWLFARCAETQQLVTVEKIGLALGYATDTLKDWRTGRRPGFSPQTKDIMKAAMQLIAASDADLANEGKIQPVVYLFRAKNYYGMSDQQEVVITPNNPLGDAQDARTIEAKYSELPD